MIFKVFMYSFNFKNIIYKGKKSSVQSFSQVVKLKKNYLIIQHISLVKNCNDNEVRSIELGFLGHWREL